MRSGEVGGVRRGIDGAGARVSTVGPVTRCSLFLSRSRSSTLQDRHNAGANTYRPSIFPRGRTMSYVSTSRKPRDSKFVRVGSSTYSNNDEAPPSTNIRTTLGSYSVREMPYKYPCSTGRDEL